MIRISKLSEWNMHQFLKDPDHRFPMRNTDDCSNTPNKSKWAGIIFGSPFFSLQIVDETYHLYIKTRKPGHTAPIRLMFWIRPPMYFIYNSSHDLHDYMITWWLHETWLLLIHVIFWVSFTIYSPFYIYFWIVSS